MNFAEKLEMAMKALSLSRAGLAAAIGVDKSVAGRWVSGKVQPSSHNLAKISRLVAEQFPNFSMLDWERDVDEFSAIFDVQPAISDFGAGTLWPLLPESLSIDAAHAAKEQTKAYEGFWRTTRPSSAVPGSYLRDIVHVSRNKDGFLVFESGVAEFVYKGAAIISNGNLYYFGSEDTFGAIFFGIYNGVLNLKADIIDGLILSTLHYAGASPYASGIVLQRIDDLSEDTEANRKKFLELVSQQNPLSEESEIDPEIIEHLKAASQSPAMLQMLFSRTMSRGRSVTQPPD